MLAVVLMAPLAMVMGMPMPIGIRMLARSAPEIIPWAWGVNGATSVMGSVAALVIAILTGFNQALFVGAGLYLLAMVFMARRQPVYQSVRSKQISSRGISQRVTSRMQQSVNRHGVAGLTAIM